MFARFDQAQISFNIQQKTNTIMRQAKWEAEAASKNIDFMASSSAAQAEAARAMGSAQSTTSLLQGFSGLAQSVTQATGRGGYLDMFGDRNEGL